MSGLITATTHTIKSEGIVFFDRYGKRRIIYGKRQKYTVLWFLFIFPFHVRKN